MQLKMGQNVPLSTHRVALQIETGTAVDICSISTGPTNKVATDDDLVFYNNRRHWSGAVELDDTGTLHIDLNRAGDAVSRISILISTDDKPVPGFSLLIIDTEEHDHPRPLAQFTVPNYESETVIIAAEIYRHNGGWKIRAVGQGFAEGLEKALTEFGIEVDAGVDASSPAAAAEYEVDTGPANLDRSGARAVQRDVTYPHDEPNPKASVTNGNRAGTKTQPSSSPWPAAETVRQTATAPTRVEQTRSAATANRSNLHRRQADLEKDTARSRRLEALRTKLSAVSLSVSMDMPSDAIQTNVAAMMSEASTNRRKLDEALNTLRQVMTSKYGRKLEAGWEERWGVGHDSSYVDPHTWTLEALALAGEIENSGTPLLKSQREALRRTALEKSSRMLVTYESARENLKTSAEKNHQSIHARHFAEHFRTAQASARKELATWETNAPEFLSSPASSIFPVWHTSFKPEDIATGVAKLNFPVGYLGASDFSFTLSLDPGHTSSSRLTQSMKFGLKPEAHGIPYTIDLDIDGGLVTNDPTIIENVILELLALTPAGRVKIDAVDPTKLGSSLNFLYGLGQIGEKIYGNKVWNVTDVGQLLIQLENHVAFITQKYLQGNHKTLTEYNREAGEVAEPYRAILLFDHPNAFTRDGQGWDQESLKRLQRLTQAGRRAGVFFFVTAAATTPELDTLATAFTTGQDNNVVRKLSAPTTLQSQRHTSAESISWKLHRYPPPTDRQKQELFAHIEREMRNADDVRVDPAQVYRLSSSALQRSLSRGMPSDDTLADPADDGTWWRGSTKREAVSRFGRMGASDVASLVLDSTSAPAALVGGRTGSGKSVLLHSLILGWALQYSPAELELYLVDFKEGVEFKPYAAGGLPHARVIAIETNRDFGISVLRSLDQEIDVRADLFKKVGGGEVNIERYREQTREVLPRIILVVDEFHMFFEEDDAAGREAAMLIERVIRQGRAFGIHAVLASQSVSGKEQMIRVALDQIRTRVALASSSKDSELLLADGNSDAQLLSKPGEGIINTEAGSRDANKRFQCAYWAGEKREDAIAHLRRLAERHGHSRVPFVFEGNAPVVVEDHVEAFTRPALDQRKGFELPIGAPMSLSSSVHARVERVGGGNLLLIGPSLEPLFAIQVATLVGHGSTVDIVDFGGLSERWGEVFAVGFADHGAVVSRQRDLQRVLAGLLAIVEERSSLEDYTAPTRVLVLPGVHRARELTSVMDSYPEPDAPTPSEMLASILVNGPEVGVHVVMWCDRYASLSRRMDSTRLREFTHKIMDKANQSDSQVLTGTDALAGLGRSQALYDNFDSGDQQLVRTLEIANIDTLWAIARGDDHG